MVNGDGTGRVAEAFINNLLMKVSFGGSQTTLEGSSFGFWKSCFKVLLERTSVDGVLPCSMGHLLLKFELGSSSVRSDFAGGTPSTLPPWRLPRVAGSGCCEAPVH